MIGDDLLLLSTDQALTSITNTSAVSNDKVDLGVARDIGEGEDLYGLFVITTAVTAGTSTAFEIVAASNAAISADIVSLGSTGAVATADLVIGKMMAVKLRPLIGLKGQRYIGARYTVVGTNGAGKVTTRIVKDIQDGKKFYASGFSVS